MKTIGMLGGMSWESTSSYYALANQLIKSKLGGLHSAKICLYSVDFHEIEQLQHAGKWQETASILTQAAKAVEAGGADFLIICTNTMHKVYQQIAEQLAIPVLHIADATAKQLQHDGVSCVGLLGTQFTMEQDFYRHRLTERFGIDVIIPESEDCAFIHQVIYQELCLGQINLSSKQRYLDIITKLYDKGAQAVILGCTEIALLVSQADTDIPLYDTTKIHVEHAVDKALE
ncbi:aspartate/glutamate racemase family protein [Thalassotalea sp. G2M2-11]|uniref:aspartate/glutamate racemase family protein n=1 Tax=Thalassotalea sp. G2M2-11 TaxID=2787627 RepID=UPI0019D020CF|nr:aspartate/glutamate racemase family protein [Thalassotalea sp. G2M2-11]